MKWRRQSCFHEFLAFYSSGENRARIAGASLYFPQKDRKPKLTAGSVFPCLSCYNEARAQQQKEEIMATVLEELRKIVERLPLDRQQRVLEFAQRLTQADEASASLSLPTTPLPPGTPGSTLLQLRFLSSREDVEG